ncbi:translation initiation factor IF-2 [Buchnera aphidicola (Taiwanaphis decaspermi)]|uniref:translation initiation factor IF-2 n=1 Tax=Buchnera aphidicola TaxID=9 RepID=UPI0031B82328
MEYNKINNKKTSKFRKKKLRSKYRKTESNSKNISRKLMKNKKSDNYIFSIFNNSKKGDFKKHSNINKRKNIIKRATSLRNKKNNNFKIKKFKTNKNKNFNIRGNKINVLKQNFIKPKKIINRDIIIRNKITVVDLSNKMAIKSGELIKHIMKMGISINSINDFINIDIAKKISENMGHKVKIINENKIEQDLIKNISLNSLSSKKKIRSPIVTIMGHVDHGKTSLLDYIRTTKIASKEFGGITQHIGAYHVKTNNGNITFLDTPGHSAFTSMRARGAKITDIVVLVIAADDGVMLQTIEAIHHAQAAKVPIIIAINKIDKTQSNFEKIKNELSKYNIISEEWGGENIFVNISAKTGIGINNLLDAILLQSEILELNVSYDCMASGVVIESYLDAKSGPVASVLIKSGVLRKGDTMLCGFEYGKIKYIKNQYNKLINYAHPSLPVKILGLSGVPISGDIFNVVNDEKYAKEIVQHRKNKFREKKFFNQKNNNIDYVFDKINIEKQSELNIILKTDVQGSLEAISESLVQLSDKKVKIKIISKGVGSIRETDVNLALASKAIILGFNVKADNISKKIILKENIDIRYYYVIYNLLNDMKLFVKGLLVPEYQQKIIGLAEVRSIFTSPKLGSIAGCMVTNGIIKKHHSIRILRKEKIIYEGKLESLRRFKEDVTEIRSNLECGISIKNFNNINIGDRIEVIKKIEIK